MGLRGLGFIGTIVAAGALGSCIVAREPRPAACSQTQPIVAASPNQRVEASGAPVPLDDALKNDEGMWLLNEFPSQRLERLHGFRPSEAWLKHVQLASVRLAGGCSGSFVSEQGLVLTNHHCASRCIEQLSSTRRDYMKLGFNAQEEKQEAKCPEMEVDQLLSIVDVTERVHKATAGRSGAAFNDALKAEQATIESECSNSAEVRCDVISLYRGGRYHLYEYRRFQDVRLVFAPEFATAFFGGDPDNFMFPRYDLDVAFLRVYDRGKPATTSEYFRWSPEGAALGDLTFVAGHPWRTSREMTVAQLIALRDHSLPERLLHLAEARGVLTEYRRQGVEQRRTASSLLFGVENSLKALRGRVAVLREPDVFAAKVAAERQLRARVDASPPLKALTAGAWENIEQAQGRFETFRNQYRLLEQAQGFWSELFEHARRLLRIADESKKPNTERLREYTDAQRAVYTKQVLSPSVIHDELEILTLTYSLTKLREELGVDNELVAGLLAKEGPAGLARRVVLGTRLKDIRYRKALFEGGKVAVDGSTDPMLALARQVDSTARTLRKKYEETFEAVTAKNSELIAQARFALFGTSLYPDATATLRLSFGQILGYEELGTSIPPFSDFSRAFQRATGIEPFELPKSWLDAKPRLNLSSPLNFCTTNDIIGGNSGSPVIDQAARIVGVVFDGNIYSLGGDYVYEPTRGRAVAVHSAAIVEALDKIYGARRILDELGVR
jgi:hypothetical protein